VAARIALRSFFLGFVADGGCCEFFFPPRNVPCLLAEDFHSGCNPTKPFHEPLNSNQKVPTLPMRMAGCKGFTPLS
jgi:hypothetical protein